MSTVEWEDTGPCPPFFIQPLNLNHAAVWVSERFSGRQGVGKLKERQKFPFLDFCFELHSMTSPTSLLERPWVIYLSFIPLFELQVNICIRGFHVKYSMLGTIPAAIPHLSVNSLNRIQHFKCRTYFHTEAPFSKSNMPTWMTTTILCSTNLSLLPAAPLTVNHPIFRQHFFFQGWQSCYITGSIVTAWSLHALYVTAWALSKCSSSFTHPVGAQVSGSIGHGKLPLVCARVLESGGVVEKVWRIKWD